MKRRRVTLFALCVAAGAAFALARADMVWAANAQKVESQTNAESDFEYEELADDKAKITKYRGTETELNVPSEIDGLTVSCIDGEAFLNCSQLKSLTIPESVSNIGNISYDGKYGSGFSGCINLEEIVVRNGNSWFSSQDGMLYDKEKTSLLCCPEGRKGGVAIPDGVQNIGISAFQNCVGLTSIAVPKSVSNIELKTIRFIVYDVEVLGAFENCGSLMEISVDAENGSYASESGMLYSKDMSKLFLCPSGKVGDISIPEGVKTIAANAFTGCKGVTGINIPLSVTDLNYGENSLSETFMGCDSLTEIRVDKGNAQYTSQDGVLYDKTRDKLLCCPAGKTGSVAIPDEVRYITNRAFNGCGALTGIIMLPRKLMGIGTGAFSGCSGLTKIASPKTWYTIRIGSKAFEDCTGLTEAALVINTLSASAFRGCHSLEMVSIKGYDIEIPDGTFQGLGNLKTVVLNMGEDGEIAVGSQVFEGCESLLNVTISGERVNIGSQAFGNCGSLESITIKALKTSGIAEDAFEGCENGLHIRCLKGDVSDYAESKGISYEIVSKEEPVITASDMEKTVGDRPFYIDAWINNDGELLFAGDNEAVATVSESGYVSIVGSGTVRVTITSPETGFWKAAKKIITITVQPKYGTKKVQTVTAADFRKTYGDRPFALGAKASGGGALSYEAADTGVASVDGKGIVTLNGCGVTEITVRAAANHLYSAAEKTVTLTVAPKKLNVTSVKSTKAKTLTVKWKKDKTADGYIIQYSTDRKFKKNVKTATVKKNKATSKKIAKLKAGKKYYVRACAYAETDGVKIMGAYKTVKKAVKVKK